MFKSSVFKFLVIFGALLAKTTLVLCEPKL